nr:hypothetical protein [uncultured Flavobacterium sp.]
MISFNSITKKLLLGLFFSTLIFSFTSCAKKVSFQTSSVVPAARGYIKVKKDANKNYQIQIRINDLAEVDRLQNANKAYVVWMETDDLIIKNIGQIKSDSGFLSSKLKASFETVTSFKPEKIFITAEENADVQYPNNQVVLTTKDF